MTFKQRQINLQFSNSAETINLEGFRCHVVMQSYLSASSAELKIWGMTMDQMNQFSSTGISQIALKQFEVTVLAGNVGGTIAQIFRGTITRATIDLSGAPDVCFSISAVSGGYDSARMVAPNSYPGFSNAETLIENLATNAGFGFSNNGAHAIVQNQYVSGSIMAQIDTIARASAIVKSFENNTIYLWPNNGYKDGVVIPLGADTGMVGYPTYWDAGFIVKSEFNPMIVIGRQLNVTTIIPQANGTWAAQGVTHELSSLMPDGPWFTTTKLAAAAYVAVN